MTDHPRRLTPSRGSLVVRGAVSAAALAIGSATLIAYGGGAFDRDPTVFADIPASAGLLVGDIGVQYQGVQVGKVVDIASGIERSRVTVRIDADEIGRVPASSLVRVVPRTLFGDVYIRLVDQPSGTRDSLRSGDELAVDTSADAVQLSKVYRQVTDLLDHLEPAKAQTALTAISTALRGRGESLGDTLDRLSSLSATLQPGIVGAIEHLPQFRQVTEALAEAAPEVLATVDNVTTLSRTVLDHASGVETLLTAAAALASSADAVVGENTANAMIVIERGAPVLSTVAANSDGLASTLDQFDTFGAAGARIFSSGRFDITAVPDFSDPLPYTAADCPRYPELDGPNCALAQVQQAALGTTQPLDAASTMLLAPLLRGTTVTIR